MSWYGPTILLLLLTLASYATAMRGGFIWDDEDYVENNRLLRDTAGLVKIWTEPKASPQYYPLVHTSFWLEYQLGRGDSAGKPDPLSFHVINVLLHALSAMLLWRILRRLKVPGAFLAAAIFAVHPVEVESVAWITERKNVLSGAFYLLAAMAYLRFGLPDEPAVESPDAAPARRRWGMYGLSLALFVCSLLSKTVTATLPAALLVVLWWKKPRLKWADVWPLTPMLVIGAAMGLMTAWLEVTHVKAVGKEWSLTFLERCLVAGRALWFYAGKVLLPVNLTFIYPRWKIDSGDVLAYLYPLAALAVIVTLFLLRRRIGKGPLAAVLFFAGTLFPALGFLNVFPMRYSWVADHFQYMASIGLIVLGASCLARIPAQPLRVGVSTVLVLVLAVLTAFQGTMYANRERLWTVTLERNSQCWMAHNNLATILNHRGQYEAAMAHYDAGLAVFEDAEMQYNYATTLIKLSRPQDALPHYLRSVELNPQSVYTQIDLAVLYMRQNQYDEALPHFQAAAEISPNLGAAHNGLGSVYMARGQLDRAIDEFQLAMKLDPRLPQPHSNLAGIRTVQGDIPQAIAEYRQAIQLQDDFVQAMSKLAWLLSTSENAGDRNGEEALSWARRASKLSAGQYPEALLSLAAASAETGDFRQAVEKAESAGQMAMERHQADLVNLAAACLHAFRANQPFRQSTRAMMAVPGPR